MVALLVITRTAMAVMTMFAPSWSTNRADAVFRQNCPGIKIDSRIICLLFFLLLVRLAVFRATAVVALIVVTRTAMSVMTVFTTSRLRADGADAVFRHDSLRIDRHT